MGYDNYWLLCDMCGFRYHKYEMTQSSYGTWRCPTCDDGDYDIQNHPQNFPFDGDYDDPKPLEHIREDTSLAVTSVAESVILSAVPTYNE